MTLPQKVQEILEKMYEKFGHMNFQGEEMRRQWTRRVAEQLVYTFGKGSGWGHKAADPGRPPSKDAIAQQQKDGRLFGWDIINGSDLSLIKEGLFHDITGQHFIEVEAVNYLDNGSDPAPPPQVPQPPTECQCKDAIGRVEAAIANVSVRLSELLTRVEFVVTRIDAVQLDVNKTRTVKGKVNAKFLKGGDVDATVE